MCRTMAGNHSGHLKADIIKGKVAEFSFFIIRTKVAQFSKNLGVRFGEAKQDFDAYSRVGQTTECLIHAGLFKPSSINK